MREQANGRSVRFRSHTHLPKKDQHVTIYNLFLAKPSDIDRYEQKMLQDIADKAPGAPDEVRVIRVKEHTGALGGSKNPRKDSKDGGKAKADEKKKSSLQAKKKTAKKKPDSQTFFLKGAFVHLNRRNSETYPAWISRVKKEFGNQYPFMMKKVNEMAAEESAALSKEEKRPVSPVSPVSPRTARYFSDPAFDHYNRKKGESKKKWIKRITEELGDNYPTIVANIKKSIRRSSEHKPKQSKSSSSSSSEDEDEEEPPRPAIDLYLYDMQMAKSKRIDKFIRRFFPKWSIETSECEGDDDSYEEPTDEPEDPSDEVEDQNEDIYAEPKSKMDPNVYDDEETESDNEGVAEPEYVESEDTEDDEEQAGPDPESEPEDILRPNKGRRSSRLRGVKPVTPKVVDLTADDDDYEDDPDDDTYVDEE